MGGEKKLKAKWNKKGKPKPRRERPGKKDKHQKNSKKGKKQPSTEEVTQANVAKTK